MKRIITTLTASLIVFALLLSIAPFVKPSFVRAAQAPNLIANPSFAERDTNNAATHWAPNSWGANQAKFTSVAGADDAFGARVDLSQYSDGDAKWMFDNVSVAGGANYTFSDSYRSDVTTHVWASFTTATGNVSYQWLKALSPATAWTTATTNFVAPANASSVTIYHVINNNGYLETDTESLRAVSSDCTSATTNGLTNSSFEDICDTTGLPTGWSAATYGTIQASSSSNTNLVHGGQRSIQTVVSGANGGEAGWYFTPQTVTPNQRYKFSCWYNSTTYLYAYAEGVTTANSYVYNSLPAVPASGGQWSHYEGIFITSAQVSTQTVHIATSGEGAVTLDDCALEALPNETVSQLNRPLISVTFDDGLKSTYNNALPVLNSLGMKSTFYVNYSTLGTTGYMTKNQVKTLNSQGHEIGSHSYHHVDLATLSSDEVSTEVTTNNTQLRALLRKSINSFATPFGSYNDSVLDIVMSQHTSQRDTGGQLNYLYSFTPRVIHSKVITKSTTLAEINALIAQANTEHAWLVLTFHGIGSDSEDYTITKATLQKYLQAVKNSKITVMPLNQALSEVQSQL